MRIFLVLVCVVLFSLIAEAQQQSKSQDTRASQAAASSDLTNLLDSKIKAEWQAIKNKDQKALGELLADDYVAVEADMNGERFRWKALSELQQSAVTDYTLSFLKVTPLCQDTAFVRYEVFVRFPPTSLVRFEKLLVGEIWVKRDGAWKSLHYQETKVR